MDTADAAPLSLNLILVCGIAFVVVLLLLGFLACVIHWIGELFPAHREGEDAAVVGAIQSTVAATLAGAKVVRVEEVPGR